MSFRRSFGKSSEPSSSGKAGSAGSGVSFSGFSFKQLEEDEDEEDLTAVTGKNDKLVEESQKAQKQVRIERSLSNSSNLSTTSVNSAASNASEPKQFEQREKAHSISSVETAAIKAPLRPNVSLPMDTTNSSPIRDRARAKYETSKELFSGLRGKITERISKTIEEFSGESSSSPSPEKEKQKLDISEAAIIEELKSLTRDKDLTSGGAFSIDGSDFLTKENGKDETEEILCVTARGDKSNVSSDLMNATKSLEMFLKKGSASGESRPSVLQKEPSTDDDSLEFHDVNQSDESKDDIKLVEQHYVSEPAEDFTGLPGLSMSMSTQARPRSKFKRMMHKGHDNQTSAVAHMSALKVTPDEDITFSIKPDSNKHGTSGHILAPTELSSGAKSNNIADDIIKSIDEYSIPKKSSDSSSGDTVPSSDTNTNNILRQLSFSDSRQLPLSRLIAVAVAVLAYLVLPIPSYFSGFIMGALIATAGCGFYMWLLQPASTPEPFVIPPLEDTPPPLVPEMRGGHANLEYKYKGWMNEIPTEYSSETYHINKTHSVFISLEGTHLRLQRPKNPAPRRAMWDESLPKPQFVHQRHFDLPGASVYLLPQGLVKKRVWSKKYPICVNLQGLSEEGDTAACKDLVLTKNKELKSEVIPPLKLDKSPSDQDIEDTKDKDDKEDIDSGFEMVTEEKCAENVMYLFARTGREKEEWFKRLSAAASGKPLGNPVLEMKRALADPLYTVKKDVKEEVKRHKREGSCDSIASLASVDAQDSKDKEDKEEKEEGTSVDLLTFAHYMGRLMPAGHSSPTPSPEHTRKDLKDLKERRASTEEEDKPSGPSSGPLICDSQLFWVNALIGRCFFDFLRDRWWMDRVMEKLQRKLSKIHVPYFIEELQVTDIHMGYEIPAIRNAGRPYLDERGFWVDMDLTYSGGFTMTIETKMNLMKLKNKAGHGGPRSADCKSPVTDSDEEDSAESSTDEEEEVPIPGEEGSTGGGTSKKFMRYLNKVTQSKYFQKATEYKVIKRAMENVSNTPLTLTVTVKSLVGKLALNIPPPPSDRLWYGFRGNPRLRLSAKPQVGERAVTITHITEWIEKKLALEFQRVMVMPNMDDLVVPILVPGDVRGTTSPRDR